SFVSNVPLCSLLVSAIFCTFRKGVRPTPVSRKTLENRGFCRNFWCALEAQNWQRLRPNRGEHVPRGGPYPMGVAVDRDHLPAHCDHMLGIVFVARIDEGDDTVSRGARANILDGLKHLGRFDIPVLAAR